MRCAKRIAFVRVPASGLFNNFKMQSRQHLSPCRRGAVEVRLPRVVRHFTVLSVRPRFVTRISGNLNARCEPTRKHVVKGPKGPGERGDERAKVKKPEGGGRNFNRERSDAIVRISKSLATAENRCFRHNSTVRKEGRKEGRKEKMTAN